MDEKTRRQAEEALRTSWKLTGWHSIRTKEEALLEVKKSLLRNNGWSQDLDVTVHGEDMWKKELNGVLTALPLEAAVRQERAIAYSAMSEDIFTKFEMRSLIQMGREAEEGTANPFPADSFGAKFWAAGHREAREDRNLTLFFGGQPLQFSESWATIEDVLKFDDAQMESCHDWVQWLFPIPEPSKFNPRAPLLSSAMAKRIGEEYKGEVERGYSRGMDSLEGNHRWVRTSDHNHLRISRALRFYTLTGFSEEALDLFHTARGLMVKRGCLTGETLRFWENARKQTF